MLHIFKCQQKFHLSFYEINQTVLCMKKIILKKTSAKSIFRHIFTCVIIILFKDVIDCITHLNINNFLRINPPSPVFPTTK